MKIPEWFRRGDIGRRLVRMPLSELYIQLGTTMKRKEEEQAAGFSSFTQMALIEVITVVINHKNEKERRRIECVQKQSR